jgi:hypothetical protein
MADKKPIKATYSGTDTNGLAEFVAADTIGVADGGTGLTTVATSNLLTGNGASALSAEANLTFDGSTLAVTGTTQLRGAQSGSDGSFANLDGYSTTDSSVLSRISFTRNGADNAGGISFHVDDSATLNQAAIITNEGKVGIGDSDPQHMLVVKGSSSQTAVGYAASQMASIVNNSDTANALSLFTFRQNVGGTIQDRGPAIGAVHTRTGGSDHGDLVFMPDYNSAAAMRITSAGNVGIGITPTTICHVYGSVANFVDTVAQASGSGSCTRFDFIGTDPDNASNMFWSAYGNNTQRAKCTSDGDVWTSDSGILTSDERLKTNIVDASDKLADIMKLRVRNYEWIPEYHPNKVGEKKLGFIAQELETVFPSLIVENDIVADNSVEEQLYNADDDTQYYVDGDDIPDDKQVGDVKAESQIPEGKAIGDVKVAAKDHEPTIRKSYKNAFVPILVKALQEVTTRLEAAEAKIATLESA